MKELLSIIIPCFNEEKVIRLTYQRLTEIIREDSIRQLYRYEFIFVDDGSRDRTAEILRTLAEADDAVRYISFSRNFGKEAAMLAGLTYASGDAVVIMDADLQHPPELIPEMVCRYRDGFDQVIARRNRKGDAASKTLTAKLYYRIINHLVDVRMDDGVGDFRLLSRKAVDALLSMQEYNRFSKGMFSWIGFKQTVINYENQMRAEGESKWSLRRLLSYGIDGLLSFNNKPLRVCCIFGALLLFVSIIYLAVIFIRICMYGIDVPGYFTTIFAVLIIGGVQLISIGILGEYIGRIYYEVKQRPHFLIQDSNVEKKQKDE